MFHIILHEPEIPPNTGNVIRLCANVGARLHLIQPLGFTLDAARLRRAGMDYAELAEVKVHDKLEDCLEEIRPPHLYALTTRGQVHYDLPRYQAGDAFLFGAESRGLPEAVLTRIDPTHHIRLPMQPGCRSVNLSNTVAVVAYEAWRQLGFNGGV